MRNDRVITAVAAWALWEIVVVVVVVLVEVPREDDREPHITTMSFMG